MPKRCCCLMRSLHFQHKMCHFSIFLHRHTAELRKQQHGWYPTIAHLCCCHAFDSWLLFSQQTAFLLQSNATVVTITHHLNQRNAKNLMKHDRDWCGTVARLPRADQLIKVLKFMRWQQIRRYCIRPVLYLWYCSTHYQQLFGKSVMLWGQSKGSTW